MCKKKSEITRFITEEQWNELRYLIDVMPQFYLDIQNTKLKVYEYNFDDYNYELVKSNEEFLSYREFEYRVRDYCQLEKGNSTAIMIILGDMNNPAGLSNKRHICWDMKTGMFYRHCSTIEHSMSPKHVLRDYLLETLKYLFKTPCDHWDVQLEDPEGKVKSIIEKYFN